MLLFVNAVGLKKILFNKSEMYVLRTKGKEKVWVRKDPLKIRKDVVVSYADMVNNLQGLSASYPVNKMFSHGDTLNIKTKAIRDASRKRKEERAAKKEKVAVEQKKKRKPRKNSLVEHLKHIEKTGTFVPLDVSEKELGLKKPKQKKSAKKKPVAAK